MTDNTHPSGVVSTSSVQGTYYSYYAFDGNNSTQWRANSYGASWIEYDFANEVRIVCMKYVVEQGRLNAFDVLVSNDSFSTSTNLYSGDASGTTSGTVPFINSDSYIQHRLNMGASPQQGNRGVVDLQFYGRVDV